LRELRRRCPVLPLRAIKLLEFSSPGPGMGFMGSRTALNHDGVDCGVDWSGHPPSCVAMNSGRLRAALYENATVRRSSLVAGHAWKACGGESLSRVRISPRPWANSVSRTTMRDTSEAALNTSPVRGWRLDAPPQPLLTASRGRLDASARRVVARPARLRAGVEAAPDGVRNPASDARCRLILEPL